MMYPLLCFHLRIGHVFRTESSPSELGYYYFGGRERILPTLLNEGVSDSTFPESAKKNCIFWMNDDLDDEKARTLITGIFELAASCATNCINFSSTFKNGCFQVQ